MYPNPTVSEPLIDRSRRWLAYGGGADPQDRRFVHFMRQNGTTSAWHGSGSGRGSVSVCGAFEFCRNRVKLG